MVRLRYRLNTNRTIFLGGVVLVTIGGVCLYLSDAVARQGSWWQVTLDAFGVGFVVGGIQFSVRKWIRTRRACRST